MEARDFGVGEGSSKFGFAHVAKSMPRIGREVAVGGRVGAAGLLW